MTSRKNRTTISPGLAPRQAAQARHYSYRLLSHLYLQGLTKDVLTMVQAVPELAGHLPKPFDLDGMAASHYQLFGFNVFPFESIFLDDSGLSGGHVTTTVALDYQRLRFGVEAAANSPDHVGQELAILAFLCQLEANAFQQEADDVHEIRLQQFDFLQKHLLRWLLPFVLAVRQQGEGFFTAVVDLTLALVADHYHHLTGEIETLVEEWTMPALPDLLNDDETGLKELAAYFTMPATSGVFLSRDDIGRLARRLNLPRGFGDRRQLLTNLMHTAVQYEQFPLLLTALKAIVKEWQIAYRSQSEEMVLLKPFTQPWLERTNLTINLVTQMRNKI